MYWFRSLAKASSVRQILLPWFTIFAVLLLVNTQDGGPNAVSRFLTLRAMDEEITFSIDQRIGATTDWSHTPDGHYYTNKAPGPMLLGFPSFFVVDQIPRLWEKGYRDEHGQRHTPGYFQKTSTSFFNQVVPAGILFAVILVWFSGMRVSIGAQTFFVLSALFGSTVSMYYNNYSGHAFEAILQLLLLFSLLKARYRWTGFAAGAALLSDYEFVLQLPAFLIVGFLVLWRRQELKQGVWQICTGAILPAFLWIWYHVACYGSPFLVASHFQNPIFLDTAKEESNYLGIFRLPNFAVGWELLFGPSRGLLFTQPWILFALLFGAWKLPRIPTALKKSVPNEVQFLRSMAALFCCLSFLGLLVVNMCYGGWWGGGAAGPRYLSGIFLCFSFWVALEFDSLSAWLKGVFGFGLAVSLLFRGLVYSSTILGPRSPLWNWYLSEISTHFKTAMLRFGIFLLAILIAGFWQR